MMFMFCSHERLQYILSSTKNKNNVSTLVGIYTLFITNYRGLWMRELLTTQQQHNNNIQITQQQHTINTTTTTTYQQHNNNTTQCTWYSLVVNMFVSPLDWILNFIATQMSKCVQFQFFFCLKPLLSYWTMLMKQL